MRFNLRSRLFASYFLLIVITLITATLPMSVILRQLPAPREEALVLLRNSMDEHGYFTRMDERRFKPDVIRLLELANQDYEIMIRYFQGMESLFERNIFGRNIQAITRSILSSNRESPLFFMEPVTLDQLARSAESMGLRLIVTSGMYARSGNTGPGVLFDSQKRLVTGEILRDFHLDGPYGRNDSQRNASFTSNFGDFRDSDGVQWVFYGMNWGWPLGLPQSQQGITVLLAEERPSQWEVLQQPLLRSLVVSSITALLLAMLISRSISRPLSAFARAAEAVAEGDLDQRVPISGPPEMRHAARAFNHMSVQVKSTQRSQQDLLANISHDLKTPLTSIQGYSQAIIDGATRNVSQAASIILHEAKRLNRMVSGLLDLSRSGQGISPDLLKEVNLSKIINRVCEQQRIQAEIKEIELICGCEDEILVLCDVDSVEQAIVNLVNNAIEFTPDKGRVKLSLVKQGSFVQIIVEDNGPGIPIEHRERIFERFYQVDPVRGPGRGTGLGLSIVREIALSHDGNVWLEEGDSGGARFIFELPA